METINERISKIKRQYYGDSRGSGKLFSESLGLTLANGRNICAPGYSVGLKYVEKILNAFPDIDANWLIMGKGDMYKVKEQICSIDIREIEDREGSSEEETPSTGIFPGSNLNKRSMKDVNQKNLRILIERIFELEEENESLKKKLGILESQSVS